jgi:hypothetical protein
MEVREAKMFFADMHFTDSRKSHRRYGKSSNFCDLHIVDVYVGKVHTDLKDLLVLSTLPA